MTCNSEFWKTKSYQIIASLVMSFQKDIIHLSLNFSPSAPALTSFCWHCFKVPLFLFLSQSFLAFWLLLLILPSLILLPLFLSPIHHSMNVQWISKWIFIYKLSWCISTGAEISNIIVMHVDFHGNNSHYG